MLKLPNRNLGEWLRRMGVAEPRSLEYYDKALAVELVADSSQLSQAHLPPSAASGSSPLTLAAQFGQWKLQAADRWVRVRHFSVGGLAASASGYKMVVQTRDAALALIGHMDNFGGPDAGDVRSVFSYGGAAAASLAATNFFGVVANNNNQASVPDVFWIRPGEQLFVETFAALTADVFCAVRFDEYPARE